MQNQNGACRTANSNDKVGVGLNSALLNTTLTGRQGIAEGDEATLSNTDQYCENQSLENRGQ
jgi:hypothetical protein